MKFYEVSTFFCRRVYYVHMSYVVSNEFEELSSVQRYFDNNFSSLLTTLRKKIATSLSSETNTKRKSPFDNTVTDRLEIQYFQKRISTTGVNLKMM